MGLFNIIGLAVGLAMDAFAVSISKGLSMKKVTLKKMLIIGGWFGVFQAVMPLIGYYGGQLFADIIEVIAPWAAFILLLFIGGKMILESRKKEDIEDEEPELGFKVMLPLAIATSIDAMAVGITIKAVWDGSVFISVSLIGIITLVISMVGVKIGRLFGMKLKSGAEMAGGVILILIGAKIILEYLGILSL
jgi:putative Mn2+ efflux pump MntP